MRSRSIYGSLPTNRAPGYHYDSERIEKHLERANKHFDRMPAHWLADEFWLGYEKIDHAYWQWVRIENDFGCPSDLCERVAAVVELMAEVCEELEAIATAELEISASHGGS